MGFRFRKSMKILPGVRLNFSAKGTSVSVGGRGATVNLSKHGTRTTVGIPGSGMSYSTYQPKKPNAALPAQVVSPQVSVGSAKWSAGTKIVLLVLGAIILAFLFH